MENTLSSVASAVTQEAVVIDVDIRPRNLIHKKLQGWKLMPVKRTFTIQPITLGSLVRISKELTGMDMGGFDKGNIMSSTYHLIEKHTETSAGIVAIAIQNNKGQVSPSLVKFILNNFTSQELLSVMAIVLRQMDVTSFISTIISMKGLSVLENQSANAKSAKDDEVSPIDQGRLIAPGIPSAE